MLFKKWYKISSMTDYSSYNLKYETWKQKSNCLCLAPSSGIWKNTRAVWAVLACAFVRACVLSQNETLQQPLQEAAALRAKRGFDDIDDEGEEDDAGGQIVEEV